MAVWVWIGRLFLVLAVVVLVLANLAYAIIAGFFRFLGMILLGGLVFEAFDDSFDCDA